MDDAPYLSGRLLLAMPGIGDPRFDHAVIAICGHDEHGALGIGIGAVVEGLGLHAMLEQLGIDPDGCPDAPIHVGGPMEPQRGFVLHSRDWGGSETIDVAGCWSMTATLDVLRAIASGRGPSQWLVALGYAGWGGGQLEAEMTRHGWFEVATDTALLFETPTASRWSAAFAQAGVDARLLSAASGHA